MKKVDLGIKAINRNINSLTCPYCSGKFVLENNSLKCSKNHCFDVSSKGYINFLSSKMRENYTKESFVQRRETFDQGFFQPVCDKILNIIKDNEKYGAILDAGCGEGSILNYILNSLDNEDFYGVAMDISKQGVLLSTDFAGENFLPIVCDLANINFCDGYFSSIINFLSPANYKEFARILKKDGLLIKVLPDKNYLKELREYFYKGNDRENYSSEDVLNHFKDKFSIQGEAELLYKVNVNREYLGKILNMTPLSWNVNESQYDGFLNIDNRVITCHFKVVWGYAC